MLEWLWHMLMSWVEIVVPSSCFGELLSLLWNEDIRFWHERDTGEHTSIRIAQKDLYRLQEACGCIPVTMGKVGGVPVFVRFCLARPGLTLGTVVLVLWCLYAEHLIWRVEIDGCDTLSETEVQAILAEHGCGIGDYIPMIDCDALHATVKAKHPEIAWLSVFLHGNTAEVQLRETKFSEIEKHPTGTYANVVAAEVGEIIRVHAYEGEPVVSAGDVVMPGELLISGVVSMKNEGQSRLEYAAGEVFAKIARPISISVTQTKEKTVYTGRQSVRSRITILGKSYQLYRNTDIPYAEFDTVETIENVRLFGRVAIPVTISSTIFCETETITEKCTSEEAVAEAMKQLRWKMDTALEKGELLEQTVTTVLEEDGTYRIDCLLYILQDIAKTEEFTVQEVPKNEAIQP